MRITSTALLTLCLVGCAPKTDGGSPASAVKKPAAGAKPAASGAKKPVAVAQKTPPKKGGGDEAAAQALFDQAVRDLLAGDELAYRGKMARLAVEHPQTRHGLAASRRTGGGMVPFAALGVMGAVAIPAFIKYTRRSKTSEASMNLRRMYDAATVYYTVEQVGRDGAVLPRQFPTTTPLTPARSACQGGNSVKHVPSPGMWGAAGWQALNFGVRDPFYYQYQFISSGTGTNAKFTARAIGDLNCDGRLSTFERIGRVDDENNVTGGAGLFKKDELE